MSHADTFMRIPLGDSPMKEKVCYPFDPLKRNPHPMTRHRYSCPTIHVHGLHHLLLPHFFEPRFALSHTAVLMVLDLARRIAQPPRLDRVFGQWQRHAQALGRVLCVHLILISSALTEALRHRAGAPLPLH